MWNKEHNGEKREVFFFFKWKFSLVQTDYISRKQDHVSHVTVSVGSHQARGSRVEPFY